MTTEHHIFIFDGTGCTRADQSLCGILADAIESAPPNKHETVRAHYFAGLGTRGSLLKRGWNSLFARQTSGEVEDVLEQAMCSDISRCSRLTLVGYSRGAALARKFAAELEGEGEVVDRMVVLDTVASLGLPKLSGVVPVEDVQFSNATLAGNVQACTHLLAMDETRPAFAPTLFNADRRVDEVWLPGTHGHVGGTRPSDTMRAAARAITQVLPFSVALLVRARVNRRIAEASVKYHQNSFSLQPKVPRLPCRWVDDRPVRAERSPPHFTFSSLAYLNRGRSLCRIPSATNLTTAKWAA